MLSTFLVCKVEKNGAKTVIYLREIGSMLAKNPILRVDSNQYTALGANQQSIT